MPQPKKVVLPEPCVQFTWTRRLRKRLPKFRPDGATTYFEEPKYVKILHLSATNQAAVEASTGGGKYEAAQSGPEQR